MYQKALRTHLRNEDYGFIWEKTNRSIFLDSLHRINAQLPKDRRISLGLTDISFDWSNKKWNSPYKYKKWLRANTYYREGERTSVRDREIAANFLRKYKKQKAIDGHRKALVILKPPPRRQFAAREKGWMAHQEGA